MGNEDARQTGEPPEYYSTPHDEEVAAWVDRVAQMASDIRDDANDDEELGVIEDEIFSALGRIERRLNVIGNWKRRNANG